MKWFKPKNRQVVDKERNKSIQAHLAERLAHINRKMSRGASNIFRMIKTRTAWGNKQLWGFKEKNRARKVDHYVPQQRSPLGKILWFRRKPKK